MQDPHVETVCYESRETDTNKFKDSDPVEDEREAFRFNLTKQGERISGTFHMKEHFATEEDARAVTDVYLRALEVQSSLVEYGGYQALHFYYISADVVDRAASPGTQALAGTGTTRTSGSGILTQTRPLPALVGAFKLTPDVGTLWYRYQQFMRGNESLLAMAYFCLTAVESYAGDRAAAANQYHISRKVLSRFANITSTRGNRREARKFDERGILIPLTQIERVWVEEVVKRLILRVGEYDYNPQQTLPELTMADFPTLPEPT